MPRRITPSQLRSKLQQAETKRRQAVQKYNSAVRTHNNQVRQRNSAVNRAIDTYNREVRTHNARVRTNRARLQSALQRLSRQTVTVRYTSLHTSVSALSTAYERLDNSSADPFLSDLAERDTANSVTVLNNLVEAPDDTQTQVFESALTSTKITESLTRISSDLNLRWAGAIFALNPENPDAGRHFCASAREIIATILNTEAPDTEVLDRFPNCSVTEQGTPTRRAKVIYCLDRSGRADNALESFIDTNITDLTNLFRELNSGAHGPAGRFSPLQLATIKTRVEDAIEFICEIVS